MNIYHKTGILETYSIGRWVEEQQKHSFLAFISEEFYGLLL